MQPRTLFLEQKAWLLGRFRRRSQRPNIESPDEAAAQHLAADQLRDLAQQLGMRTVWIGIPLNGLLLLMTANDVFVLHRYPAISFFIYLVSTVVSHLVAYLLLLKRRPFAALAAIVGIGEVYLLINLVLMREVGIFVFSLLPFLTPALVFSRRATALILGALFAGLLLGILIQPTLRTADTVRTLVPSMVIVIAVSSNLLTISTGIHRSRCEFARLAVEREKDAAVRERAEAQRRAAEEANDRKTQFLAMINHELRTPLTSINGFTALLLNNRSQYGPLTPTQEELLNVIQDSGKHLRGLIDDILDLAKIESGKIELTFAPVDLALLLEGAMAVTSAAVAEKGLTINLDLPSTPLSCVWAGEKQVRQVILNLVSNAVKFTRQGSITIRAMQSEDQRMVQVAVSDTGIGIAPADQERIWEEFQQVDNDLGREYSGTGLGLPIARKLVERHGGRMWLESEIGRGSTFYCTFPVIPNSLALETAASQGTSGVTQLICSTGEVAQAPTTSASCAGSINVMIVDGNPQDRRLLRTMLAAEHCQVFEAPDGQRALALLPHLGEPSVIILDLLLPGLNGLEVLSHLHNDPAYAAWASIPVIVVTTKDLTPHEESWLLDNFHPVVHKQHLRSSEFLTLVQSYLRQETHHEVHD
jgi:signal transduction histidine kinase/CheY-like chemotaxis protein